MKTVTKKILCYAVLLISSASTNAAELQIIDADGNALVDAVLVQFLTDVDTHAHETQLHVMEQVNRQFSPQRLIIRAGDEVTFPNNDNVRHHVYSFSPARTFELRLFETGESPAVEFPNQGVVAVGCNIHDQMEGYILVTGSPHYRVSDRDGKINYPQAWQETTGWYVWHRWMSHQGLAPVAVTLGGTSEQLRLQVRRPPEADESNLEQRFRRRVIRGGN